MSLNRWKVEVFWPHLFVNSRSRLFRNFLQCICHFWAFSGCKRCASMCIFGPNMPPRLVGTGNICYCANKNELGPVTFVNQFFRNFSWNDDVKCYFCIVGPSWMGSTHGNVIFGLELNTQLLKIQHRLGLSSIFLFNFFFSYLYFATRPSPSPTAVM